MCFQKDLLNGQVALVTGGGTGIGRGIALALAAHGCDVAITSRNRSHLGTTADEIRRVGRRALAAACDVRHPAEVQSVVAQTVEELGGLNILVNCAAGNFFCMAEDLSPNGFGTVVDIDLKGTFNVSHAALPHLKARTGTILNISATLHYLGTIGQVHAAAAKAGVDALTRTLATEWGPLGVRVNGIAPGPTDETEGTSRLLSAGRRDAVIRQCPLRRLARVDDIARAALFLCSGASSFINGVTLVVDGGLWLHNGRISPPAIGATDTHDPEGDT